jgi:hypothetical protein
MLVVGFSSSQLAVSTELLEVTIGHSAAIQAKVELAMPFMTSLEVKHSDSVLLYWSQSSALLQVGGATQGHGLQEVNVIVAFWRLATTGRKSIFSI